MEVIAAAAWALGQGILTSVSPCPLATNIAAISFLSRRLDSPRRVLLAGGLYTLGRSMTYVVLALLLVSAIEWTGGPERPDDRAGVQTGDDSPPEADRVGTKMGNRLRRFGAAVQGPLLILVAMILLELIHFRLPGMGVSEKTQKRVEAWGVWGALLLGVLFALAFCPVSAAWFFGIVMEAAKLPESKILLALTYGVGTALPVVGFTLLIAFSAQSLGKIFNAVLRIEWWLRRIVGVLLLAWGILLTLTYTLGLFPMPSWLISA